MIAVAVAFLAALGASLRSRASLQAEIVALRHQLAVLQRAAPKRLRLRLADRMLWVLLSRFWYGWRSALTLVHPDTVVAWHRKGFAMFWNWKSRRGRAGRPALARRIRDLVRQRADENPLWGAARIHGELLKLGIQTAESTVSKYLRRRLPRQRPAQTWKTFLRNHLGQTVSMDFFNRHVWRAVCVGSAVAPAAQNRAFQRH